MGKSTLARQRVSSTSRLFLVDNQAEYSEGLIFETYPDLEDYFDSEPDEFRCICRFHSDEEIDQLFDLAWETGDCTILAEECDWYAPVDGSGSRKFLEIVKWGRHRSIDVIAVSRTPAEISKMLTSQADEIVSFQQTEPRHIDYLAKYGFDPERLKTLEQFSYETVIQ